MCPEKGVRTIPAIVIAGVIFTLARPGNLDRAQCTRCNDSSSLNAIIRFTWTPGRRMSREFLRTCSNTLPLLVETVEADRRYIEGGTDSFIMTRV